MSINRFSDPFEVGVTSWELQQVLANPQFRRATDFYLNGRVLTSAERAALGIG